MEPKYYADGEDAYAMKRDLTQMAEEVRRGPMGSAQWYRGLLLRLPLQSLAAAVKRAQAPSFGRAVQLGSG